MPQIISISGFVGTVPETSRTSRGELMTRFRLGCPQSYFDKATQRFVDQDVSWYSVTSFRQLAANVEVSINKGDHVMVTGSLKIAQRNGIESSGIYADLDAKAVGHDLSYGQSTFLAVAPVGARERVVAQTPAGQQGNASGRSQHETAAADLHDPDSELAQLTATLAETSGIRDTPPWPVVAAASVGEAGIENGADGEEPPF